MIISLSNRHIPVAGWSHVPPTGGSINTPLTSQSFSFFAQAAALASSAYGPGPLRPRVRNTPLLAEGCGAANFCVAILQQHERDRVVNSMLRSAYQQRKKEDQQNMSYAAAAVALERIKNQKNANYQRYGGGTHPAAAPPNLVAAQNHHARHWHEQEYKYRAAVAAHPLTGSALYRRQLMAQQQQQLTRSTMCTSPPLTSKKLVKTMPASAKKTAKEQDGNTGCNIKMLQPPRRKPLSAYNFFFQDERAKLIGSEIIEKEHDNLRELKKRRHRKAHGKIGFTQLARHVGQRWKTLDAETRKFYDVKCQQDKKRHAAELAEYEEQLSNMIHRAQVKLGGERRNMKIEHRIVVGEAKLLELQETSSKRKAALEEQHSKQGRGQQLVREKV
jgi:hypothetical protein